MANVAWGGPPVKMVDGSDPQPWHCLPFVEGSTYGLELLYPHETECHVVHANGTIHFEWDYTKEPGGVLTGAEFGPFSPVNAAKYYLFNPRMDIQCPPGYVLRTEPHPRYFTDDTGTVPLPMIGHLQNEWFPRMVFVVFRAPRPGQRHIFRKGEPFAQILLVPHRMNYELAPMTAEEAAKRRELEKTISTYKLDIAENIWSHPDGGFFSNHYKLLARAFAREGMAGVEKVIGEAAERHALAVAKCKTIGEALALAAQLFEEHKTEQAFAIYSKILEQDPNNAEALSNLGTCYTVLGYAAKGIEAMKKAISLEPRTLRYHTNLSNFLQLMGRFQEAETWIRSALQLNPNDPLTLSVLGLVLAQQGRTAQGLQAYRASRAIGLPLPRFHVSMGLVLAQQNLHAEARECFEAALAIDPESVPARRALQELPKG